MPEMQPRTAHLLANVFAAPIFVLLLNFVALRLYLIWPDFDIPMHFLGGCAIAIGWMVIRRAMHRVEPHGYAIMTTVAVVALAAVLWEFSEYLADRAGLSLAGANQPSVSDTMGDLFFGLCGGIFTSFIAIYLMSE